MPKDGEVRVSGYAELERGSKMLFERIAEAAPEAFLDIAQAAAAATSVQVPVLTGALAGSVTAALEGDKATVGIGEGVPYAGWIEFGGSHGRPYVDGGRYLFPTALNVEQEISAAAERAADTEIGDMRWPSP